MDDCIFCKIIKGDIPSKKVFENDYVYAFYDIAPCAPVHVLVVPKKHITSAKDLTAADTDLLAQIFNGINKVAELTGVADSGYRVVTNVGRDAGQSVLHLHFHVLGGKLFGADFG